jgi:hypothetical protein
MKKSVGRVSVLAAGSTNGATLTFGGTGFQPVHPHR